MRKITGKQQELLDFYLKLQKETGRNPSVTELSDEYGRARSTVYETLLSLEKKGYLERSGGTFVLPKKEREENTLIQVPLYRSSSSINEDAEDSISLPRSLGVDEDSFAILNHSDEMIGVGIVPGDTLVFSRETEPENDAIVLASIQGEDEEEIHVIRRYRERNERIELIPENDSIGIITTHKCRILGILEVKLRKYRS